METANQETHWTYAEIVQVNLQEEATAEAVMAPVRVPRFFPIQKMRLSLVTFAASLVLGTIHLASAASIR